MSRWKVRRSDTSVLVDAIADSMERVIAVQHKCDAERGGGFLKKNKREPVNVNESFLSGDCCFARYQGGASDWFIGRIEVVHREGSQVFLGIIHDAVVHYDDARCTMNLRGRSRSTVCIF